MSVSILSLRRERIGVGSIFYFCLTAEPVGAVYNLGAF
jgi:hypothetical protein